MLPLNHTRFIYYLPQLSLDVRNVQAFLSWQGSFDVRLTIICPSWICRMSSWFFWFAVGEGDEVGAAEA